MMFFQASAYIMGQSNPSSLTMSLAQSLIDIRRHASFQRPNWASVSLFSGNWQIATFHKVRVENGISENHMLL